MRHSMPNTPSSVPDIAPQITWGTSPQDVIDVTGRIPDPSNEANAERRKNMEAALKYMGLRPGDAIEGTPVDWVFIGSCTNGRLSDLREAAQARSAGRKVAASVRAWIVPGSVAVKRAAEREGLHRQFIDAGFEWREPGCSMCVGANGDIIAPGERSVSTTNRNFVGRQGPGARTHLASPAMAVAAAVDRTNCRHPQTRPLIMDKFIRVTGAAAPLMRINIDTEVVIPMNRLVAHKRGELGRYCFEAWRYGPDGSENPEFVLNKPRYREAKILVTGDNFGCGSSREHAVWSLSDFGFRCVIAPSFGDIFYWNCFQNGVLPIRLPQDQVKDARRRDRGVGTVRMMTVDLETQSITTPAGRTVAFTGRSRAARGFVGRA